jgi:hypothetical protein
MKLLNIILDLVLWFVTETLHQLWILRGVGRRVSHRRALLKVHQVARPIYVNPLYWVVVLIVALSRGLIQFAIEAGSVIADEVDTALRPRK